jgi:YjbE family integral membrane protein
MSLLVPDAFAALVTVIVIDLALAADNAIVIGLAAAALPQRQRTKAVLFGIIAATALRIALAAAATQLLQIVGLLLAGGLLLLWVSWKMLRELLTPPEAEADAGETLKDFDVNADGAIATHASPKTFAQAAGQIVVADVSMSLDNVLAVAGAARDHMTVLIIGLGVSIALMGFAATFIASLLSKHRWIAYLGLAMIFYVAAEMIHRGVGEVWPVLS